MNDEFLNDFRRDPRPEFARSLRARLRRQEAAAEAPAARPAWARRWAPALAGTGAIAVLVALLTVPAVRTAAQSFLELFRAKQFVAVKLDAAKLDQLANGNLDFKSLIAEQVEVLQEPGEPRRVADAFEAAREAGMTPKLPTIVPPGYPAEPVLSVRGEGRARVIGSTAKLETILSALDIDDVSVPRELDGAVIDIRMPASVIAEYGERRGVVLVQSPSPEVTLPTGTDLEQLGVIALRISGMSAEEAAQFADTVDWNSTLLVPVPPSASIFREVDVQGAKGLLVSFSKVIDGGRTVDRTLLLWSDGGTVFALQGAPSPEVLLQMANSMQ